MGRGYSSFTENELPLEPETVQWMTAQVERQLAAFELEGYEHESERWEGVAVCKRIVERVAPEERFEIDVLDASWIWEAKLAQ